MMTSTQNRLSLPLLLSAIALSAASAGAQQNVPPPVAGKTFDVVSIRQNISPTGPNTMNLTPAPDGFQVTHMPLSAVLMTAYTPKAGGVFLNNVENMPDWVHNDRYDIDARIANADRAAWNDPKNQPAMLQEMLQAMLADRYKLVVHRSMKEVPVYELVIAKGGPKLTEIKPGETIPAGQTLPGGAVVARTPDGPRMYNFSMSLLASALSENGDRPVVDKTGLTGRYDIVLPRPAADYAAQNDPEAERLDLVKSLGLKLEPAKQQVEFLVVDHIERPTEN